MKNYKLILLVLVLTFCILSIFSSLVFADEVGRAGLNVVSTTPSNGASNVELNSKMKINFSQEINKDSLPAIMISTQDGVSYGYGILDSAGNNISSDDLIPSKQLVIEPCGLEPNTTYTVEIFWYKDDDTFNPYTFSFKTVALDSTSEEAALDQTMPKVVSTNPVVGAVNVDLNPEIDVTFSKDVYNISENDAEVNIYEYSYQEGYGILYNCSLEGKELILKPDQTLKANTKYIVKIGKTFVDNKGNISEAYSFYFTTKPNAQDFMVERTIPRDGETLYEVAVEDLNEDLSLVLNVNVFFSKPIKNISIYDEVPAGAVIVKDEKGTEISFDANTLYTDDKLLDISIHSRKDKPLIPGKYTVYINKGYFQDELGNKNESYSFDFIIPSSGVKESTTKKTFSDLPSNHWAYEAVSVMAEKGIINGYSDGKFGPNDNVTREQFAKMMVLALNLPVTEPATPTFKDVDTSYWAYKYVESAKSYLTGSQEANGLYFNGIMSAIREDVAYALVEAKKYDNKSVDVSRLSSLFNDSNKITQSMQKYVLIAYDNGFMKGNADGTFKPKGTLTRAEAAQLLYNVLMLDKQ